MTHEIRFRGQLLEHMDEEDARDYVQRRLEHPVEGPAFNPKDWTIAPRRPVELRRGGVVADTFDDVASAEKTRDALVKSLEKRRARMRLPLVVRAMTVDAFAIVDTRKKPYQPPTVTPIAEPPKSMRPKGRDPT